MFDKFVWPRIYISALWGRNPKRSTQSN